MTLHLMEFSGAALPDSVKAVLVAAGRRPAFGTEHIQYGVATIPSSNRFSKCLPAATTAGSSSDLRFRGMVSDSGMSRLSRFVRRGAIGSILRAKWHVLWLDSCPTLRAAREVPQVVRVPCVRV